MTSREYIHHKATVMSRALDELSPTFGGKNPIGEDCELPSEAEVLQVLALLDDIFYPGYRSPWNPSEPVETLVIERLDEAYDILYRLVKRALPMRKFSKYGAERANIPCSATDEWNREAERVVGEFFAQLPHIREMLKLDVIAAYKGDPAAHSYTEIILSYPGLRAITTHRIAHELYRLEVPLIPRLMSEHIHARTGIDIHPGARIGESFFIDHGTGVVIGETTIIGNRVRIYHGVTLGARSVKTDDTGVPLRPGKRHPTIEDDVVIYPGATILGGDTVIGAGATIGGNVWLLKSVNPGTTVTMTPGNYALKGMDTGPEI